MRILVFYGTDCNKNTAWLPWLSQQLSKIDISCVIADLPTPKNQTYNNWYNVAQKIKPLSDDIVVGWSTGAIFAVRYLYETKQKVKKLILISGFNNYIGNVPFVDNINKDFFLEDLNNVKHIADEIVCIISDNDPFISQEALISFADELNAKVVSIPNGGHFNSNAGYDKFDELLKLIKD